MFVIFKEKKVCFYNLLYIKLFVYLVLLVAFFMLTLLWSTKTMLSVIFQFRKQIICLV